MSNNQEKILKLLIKSNRPISIKELHLGLHDIDLVTVYRNVEKLVSAGMVREFKFKKGESLYERSKQDHHHAVCTKCGRMECIDIDTKKILKELKLKNFEIEDIDITVKGHCKN